MALVSRYMAKELNATDSSRKPNEYAQMISLFKKEVVRKLCYDLKLMGQCSVQVIYNKNRTKIVKLEHIPVETLRAAKGKCRWRNPCILLF